jgi:hypothetical protein
MKFETLGDVPLKQIFEEFKMGRTEPYEFKKSCVKLAAKECPWMTKGVTNCINCEFSDKDHKRFVTWAQANGATDVKTQTWPQDFTLGSFAMFGAFGVVLDNCENTLGDASNLRMVVLKRDNT